MAHGFAHGERRHRVAVHVGEQLGVAAEVAVGALRAAEVVEPAGDVVGVGALAVRVAGAEERQQRERRDAGVGPGAGAAAVLAQDVALLPGAEALGVPAAVGLCAAASQASAARTARSVVGLPPPPATSASRSAKRLA